MSACNALGGAPYVVWRWTGRTPDAPVQARAALRCALDQLGLGDDVVSDAVLVASEIVTNATVHAVGPYEMRLSGSAAEIVCEVEDRDPRIPEFPAFHATAPYAPVESDRGGGLDALCSLLSERGRGLHIVHELTKGAWGFRCGKNGTKVAWFAISAVPVTGSEPHSRLAHDPGLTHNLWDL